MLTQMDCFGLTDSGLQATDESGSLSDRRLEQVDAHT